MRLRYYYLSGLATADFDPTFRLPPFFQPTRGATDAAPLRFLRPHRVDLFLICIGFAAGAIGAGFVAPGFDAVPCVQADETNQVVDPKDSKSSDTNKPSATGTHPHKDDKPLHNPFPRRIPAPDLKGGVS